MTIPFIDPKTRTPLHLEGDRLVSSNGTIVATIQNGLPRFVDTSIYAENFGYQWNKWEDILSDERSMMNHKFELIINRTNFDKLETSGKTILECGCGGGDDTEILLKLPFKEVYSFDLSNAVDRANRFFGSNPRLRLFQASILEIPVPDESFDFVYCHRVLQHTPDPLQSLQSIMSKVKPGGILFIHSYHRSKQYMQNYKYKYRFITKRLPYKFIELFLEWFGRPMHEANAVLHKNRYTKWFANSFIPMEYYRSYSNFDKRKIIELEKLVTFDALTPAYDNPITWDQLKSAVEGSGFKILYSNPAPKGSPIYLTAERIK